ncbi:hypothetical protein CDV31_014226, partial [Fusarium ambrosium]
GSSQVSMIYETKAQELLTVIGYPTDLVTAAGGPGSEMYEFKICREMDLERNKRNMLVYQGDTQGGFSGAPVIRDNDFAVIGVHVRGGSMNSAAVVGGRFGVDFQIYQDVLGKLKNGDDPKSGLRIESVADKKWLKNVYITL